jgi:hypothetical protein
MKKLRTASLLVVALVVGCRSPGSDSQAEFRATRVVVHTEGETTWLVRGQYRRSLAVLDADQVIRFAKITWPHAVTGTEKGDRTVDLDTPGATSSFMEMTLWADGLVLSRRGLRERFGTPPISSAGVVAETLRAYLLVDPPVGPPNWVALSRALENETLWEESPQSAGTGAILLAGAILLEPNTSLSRALAGQLLSRAVADVRVPAWLTRAAYRMWSDNDFRARADSP